MALSNHLTEPAMTSRRQFLLTSAGALALLPLRAVQAADGTFAVTHTEQEWRTLLTPTQFAVLRQSSTERPHTSPLNDEKRSGRYACAGCRRELFSSKTKFNSGTGWPSFWAPLEHAVDASTDRSFGMLRSAVSCRGCGGHQGHVFDDERNQPVCATA